MWKQLIIVLICSTFLFGCSLSSKRASIEVISNKEARVILNGKEVGMTPYKNNTLSPGEIEVKLREESGGIMQKKIILQNNVNTVIDWYFGDTDDENGGYVLSMEKIGNTKKCGLLVNTSPVKAGIMIDDQIKGYSPTRLEDIGDNDKKITILFPGYKNINVYVKSIKGYQLIIDGQLPKEKEEILENVSETTPVTEIVKKIAVIKSTETGWLRVRKEADKDSEEINKVKPGEKYEILDSNAEWVKIKLSENQSGWVAANYVEIKSE